MKIGTKSILFGAHCFLVHPIFVAIAWIKLYGFPWKIQYWIAFFVHDLGYWAKPNIDGKEGETHVELGAKIMNYLFGKKWENFSMYHSRFYAKKHNRKISKLCIADKLAIALEPSWFFLLRVNLSGEIKEFMNNGENNNNKYGDGYLNSKTQKEWFTTVCNSLKKWSYDNKDLK